MRLRDDHTLRRGGRYKEYSTRKTLLDAQDMEMKEHIVYLPPDWIARVTDIQYEITTIRSRCTFVFLIILFVTPFLIPDHFIIFTYLLHTILFYLFIIYLPLTYSAFLIFLFTPKFFKGSSLLLLASFLIYCHSARPIRIA